MKELNEVIQQDNDSVVVTGVGQHQMWAAQFLFFDGSDKFVTSGGLGTMGFELSAAIGAQMGRPNDPLWTIAGDGGFQMHSQELATMVQEGLPIKIVLINNSYLGMVRQWQEMFFDNHIICTYRSVQVYCVLFCGLVGIIGRNAIATGR